LPTDLALKVFTDPSLRLPGENGSSHTDNEVLSVVGEAATEAAYSAILFARQPGLTAEELKEIRADWMSPKTITPWLEHYKEFQNVRVLPTKERTPDTVWRAFYAYMGALYLSRGDHTLQRLLQDLIGPQYTTPGPTGSPPPSWTKPQLQAPNVSSISILNQEAQKQGFKVEYFAESKGIAHALQWEVNALVNGKHQGRGTALSKQAAKEAAAKAVLIKIGNKF